METKSRIRYRGNCGTRTISERSPNGLQDRDTGCFFWASELGKGRVITQNAFHLTEPTGQTGHLQGLTLPRLKLTHFVDDIYSLN